MLKADEFKNAYMKADKIFSDEDQKADFIREFSKAYPSVKDYVYGILHPDEWDMFDYMNVDNDFHFVYFDDSIAIVEMAPYSQETMVHTMEINKFLGKI